jgi:hypothetical protein
MYINPVRFGNSNMYVIIHGDEMYIVMLSPHKIIDGYRSEDTPLVAIADRMRFSEGFARWISRSHNLLRHNLAGLYDIEVHLGIWNGSCEPVFFVNILSVCMTDLVMDITTAVADWSLSDKLFIGSFHEANLPQIRLTEVYHFDLYGNNEISTQDETIKTFQRFLETEYREASMCAYFVRNALVVPSYVEPDKYEEYLDQIFEDFREWLLVNEGIAASFVVNHRIAHGMLATKAEDRNGERQ